MDQMIMTLERYLNLACIEGISSDTGLSCDL